MNVLTVTIEKPADMNFILGHSHFIKTVADLYEAIVQTVPAMKFGIAFCEASGPALVRYVGKDVSLIELAQKNAMAIGAGHTFIFFMESGFPVNILNTIKNVPEECRIYCATANPAEVIVADEVRLLPLAETAARRALSIEPRLGEAHAVLAQVNVNRGEYLDAESGFFFAISLEPNEPTPHHWYSILLAKVGRLDDALAQARRAHELDTTSPIIAANLAHTLLLLGQDAEALRYSQRAVELGLNKSQTGVEVAVAIARKQWPEAKRLLEEQEHLPPELRSLVGKYVDALEHPARRPAVLGNASSLRRATPRSIT